MRKILLLVLICPLIGFSQVNWKSLQKNSSNVFAYKITEAIAEKYIRQDSIDIDAYVSLQPDRVFAWGKVDESQLPKGLYIIIKINDNKVVAYLTAVTDLVVYPINNQHRVQLLVRNKKGEFIPDATVYINDNKAVYQSKSQSYTVKQKNPDDALVKVFAQNDTAFFSLSSKDDLYKSVSEQRRDQFLHSRTVTAIKWLPRKIKALFSHQYKNYRSDFSGTIIFNQPKYKITDSVKLKAYAVKKKKQYKKEAGVYLNYYANGSHHEQFLQHIQPSAPGSFVYSFPLNDSMTQDTRYSVILKTKNGKPIVSGDFQLEDYLLDEVSSYKVRADKEDYYQNDTMHFYASATDANGLSLLDGTAKLVVTAYDITGFDQDTVYVADTLFMAEKSLVTEGETVFVVPASQFPEANLSIKANLIFKNSNNEIQEENTTVNYKVNQAGLFVKQADDSLFIDYKKNGTSVPAVGYYEPSGDHIDDSISALYPLHIKIDPLSDSYDFYVTESKKKLDSVSTNVESNYRPLFSSASTQDTIGFVLENKYRIPVSYTVFDGNTIVSNGKSDSSIIQWTKKSANKHKIYVIKWQYWWAGEEKHEENRIGLLYKKLTVSVENAKLVFPGQRDSITIKVTDYKNKPASNVNLTAVSYNSQFAKDIRVKNLPNLAKYRSKKILLRNTFESDDAYISGRYSIGLHTGWVKKFSVDTLPYYQMLMPGKAYADYVTRLTDKNTEVSVHIIQKSEQQEVHLLYLNRELKYYNSVTDKMADAYSVFPGYTKIAFRLYDKFIELDSVYLQPFYKHDLFIDLDHLPSSATILPATNYFTNDEKHMLENSIWMLANKYETNDCYAWQGSSLVTIKNNQYHTAGPFITGDSMHVFVPGNFDIHFRFEPGYEYNLSKQIERLEKKKLFPDPDKKLFLEKNKKTPWILGDTIPEHPVIKYSKAEVKPFIKTGYYVNNSSGDGKMLFYTKNKQPIIYSVLYSEDLHTPYFAQYGQISQSHDLPPGRYSLLFVSDSFYIAQTNVFLIKNDTTLCLRADTLIFQKNNQIVAGLLHYNDEKPIQSAREKTSNSATVTLLNYGKGQAGIVGKVTDKKGGHPVEGVSVIIKGSSTGTVTDSAGSFVIRNIRPGKCILSVNAIGYYSNDVIIDAIDNQNTFTTIELSISNMSLSEVVVTSIGISRKRDITGAVSYFSEGVISLTNQLQGRAFGVSLGYSTNTVIRGGATLTAGNKMVYIIDGVFYDDMPKTILPDMITSTTILKGEDAVSLYGERAAGGAIVITTSIKTSRNHFRDYAIWRPQMFTDKNGKSSFVAHYPDNITGWQLYVLGMDKKNRVGKSISYVQSYKPISAQLSLPQFLTEGDTAAAVGKLFNYTDDTYQLNSSFKFNNHTFSNSVLSSPKSSSIQYYNIYPESVSDTVTASFSASATTGFTDAEERKIPVFKKGTEEAVGQFYVLQKDTAITFTTDERSSELKLYAQNNTLQLLLDETEHLKEYPYYCMEQTASKLRGLLAEKQINETLSQPFKDEKSVSFLVNKLQKAQLYEGGWSWWERGQPDVYITNYVVNALLPLRKDAAIENSIRNGLLYLQNHLARQNKDALLQTLVTTSNAKNDIDYKPWLEKIAFDSLSQYQQWLYVKLKQNLQLDHERELDTLCKQAVNGVLGSMHWGKQTWFWYNNNMSATVLAFDVLSRESKYKALLPHIVQYFLEQRKNGYWINTVESASVVSSILPYVLSQNEKFMQPATINITGDTSFTIHDFPAKTTMNTSHVKQVNIQKSGGGITYFTLYQDVWNKASQPVQDLFVVSTKFEKNGQQLNALKAGEKIKMIIDVKAIKEADYVMIEVPIPAGCVYADKAQNDWQMHEEFMKNKMVLFAEHIAEGKHTFEVELETRYSGTFTLNPAKVSLMYFPTFYGRNDMKQVSIKSE